LEYPYQEDLTILGHLLSENKLIKMQKLVKKIERKEEELDMFDKNIP